MVVRRYRSTDRAAVRRICCDTADRGEPVEQFFHDRDVFADLLTVYYTEEEPSSVWVAEHDGRVVGYLTGCLDSRRYRRATAWRIVPRAVLNGLRRGHLGSVKTWRLAWAALRTWRYRWGRAPLPLADYPAHIHLNVERAFRGRGLGRQLLERFMASARSAGVPGLYAAVRADNTPSCHLFERMGFHEVNRYPVIFPDGAVLRRHETIIYGKRLAPPSAET